MPHPHHARFSSAPDYSAPSLNTSTPHLDVSTPLAAVQLRPFDPADFFFPSTTPVPRSPPTFPTTFRVPSPSSSVASTSSSFSSAGPMNHDIDMDDMDDVTEYYFSSEPETDEADDQEEPEELDHPSSGPPPPVGDLGFSKGGIGNYAEQLRLHTLLMMKNVPGGQAIAVAEANGGISPVRNVRRRSVLPTGSMTAGEVPNWVVSPARSAFRDVGIYEL